jgi:hypothetical protein
MGSFNSYPVPETTPAGKQQQTNRQETIADEDILISMLINAIHYFIECVFILQSKDKFRLVVLHQSKVLYDKYYPTERGCRIAFGKFFKDKAWSEEIKADWSHFYDPDKRWLEKKCKCLELGKR